MIPGLLLPHKGCFSPHCIVGGVVPVVLNQKLSDGALSTVVMSGVPVTDGPCCSRSGSTSSRLIAGYPLTKPSD